MRHSFRHAQASASMSKREMVEPASSGNGEYIAQQVFGKYRAAAPMKVILALAEPPYPCHSERSEESRPLPDVGVG